MNQVAATAVTMKKIASDSFKNYAFNVLKNAKKLSEALLNEGFELITGGTENHLIVIDTLKSVNLDGKKAEEVLDEVGITTNKQIIPDDPNPPLKPSGIRIGTPAITSRGMMESDMINIGKWVSLVLKNADNDSIKNKLTKDIREFSEKFVLPGI